MSVLAGNAAIGARMRGVTNIQVDSFKDTTVGGGNLQAVQRAYQAAAALGNNVVNQSQDIPLAAVNAAADQAFDNGIVVVGANGNDGGTPTNHIAFPGYGHKVIAAGALDSGKNRAGFSSTGPTNEVA